MNNNHHNTIAGFLERQLCHLSKNHKGIPNVTANEQASFERIRDSINRFNKTVNIIEFENIEIDKSEVILRNPFNKQRMYEAVASKSHYFQDNSFAGKTKLEVTIIL